MANLGSPIRDVRIWILGIVLILNVQVLPPGFPFYLIFYIIFIYFFWNIANNLRKIYKKPSLLSPMGGVIYIYIYISRHGGPLTPVPIWGVLYIHPSKSCSSLTFTRCLVWRPCSVPQLGRQGVAERGQQDSQDKPTIDPPIRG